MVRSLMLAATVAAFVAAGCAAEDSGPIDAAEAVGAASAAMGLEGLDSITYSGTAWNVNFGQTPSASGPWQGIDVENYMRSIDFAQPASRATGTTMAPPATGGPPQAGNYNQNITPQNAAWTQQLEIWITPWGFLRGAAANAATGMAETIAGRPYRVITWTTTQTAPSGLPYTVRGYINDADLVERVETWVEHPVAGDLHVEALYSNYTDYDGVMVPGNIVQQRAGHPTFEATVASARVNPVDIAELLTPPAPPGGGPGGGGGRGAGGSPPAVGSEQLAPGVHRITGGYVSLAIEFADHIVVFEGGQNEARGLAVIAEAKRVIPDKPIRYVVNSHPHFDHASGLAPFVAEGATIITHANNREFLEMALSSPRTLAGDTLANSNMRPQFETVDDLLVLADDTRRLELHHVQDLAHSDGMLVGFLPAESILFQADFSLPQQPGQAVNPSVVTLVENIERLGLDFDSYVGVHAPNPDRIQTRDELMAVVGN